MRAIIRNRRWLSKISPPELSTAPAGSTSGGAKGVDTLGERYADFAGIPVQVFPTDWSTHGRSAGPIRNRQMAEYADALIAVWDGKSRGTKNMIDTAKNLGLKMYVHIAVSGAAEVTD